MKYVLGSRDIKMGNEDEWSLVVSDDKTEVYINHCWSHRNGNGLNFKSGKKKIAFNVFKLEFPSLYKKAVDILHEKNLSELIPE